MLNESKLTKHQLSKLVAVVVPLYNRKELTPEEEISFRHLVHFLGKYDKYLVISKSLKVDFPGFKVKRFSNRFFGSAKANTKLMLSPKFYKEFTEYKYILIYHLDSLVFSDQLAQWCNTDLDYIGPPWIKCQEAPWVEVPRSGNGGFSLRKIDSFLKVLYSSRKSVDPDEYWENTYAFKPRSVRYFNFPKKYLKRLRFFNNVRWRTFRWGLNEDRFWSDEAIKYYPEFKVASFQVGLHFAFECVPRYCFELNNYRLPFGCHAWHRYDRDFWEPYLLR